MLMLWQELTNKIQDCTSPLRMHQSCIHLMDMRSRSIVAQFIMTKAQYVVHSKFESLKYSTLHYIGIISDTPRPQKHHVANTLKPDRK